MTQKEADERAAGEYADTKYLRKSDRYRIERYSTWMLYEVADEAEESFLAGIHHEREKYRELIEAPKAGASPGQTRQRRVEVGRQEGA